MYELTSLEFVWTGFPITILLLIGFPSLRVLYQGNIDFERDVTLKVTGHQWYWSYDYSDFPGVEFDSFIMPTNALDWGGFRLLEVDNRIVLPRNLTRRLVVSSGDVLHSWAMPRMGLKVDACPGRLNFLFLTPSHYGLFYGQCSEICGSNHRFIPICLEVSSFSIFVSWLNSF